MHYGAVSNRLNFTNDKNKGHRKQREVKLDRLEFLCVQIYHILLPSSAVVFVPCDQLVRKAHLTQVNDVEINVCLK